MSLIPTISSAGRRVYGCTDPAAINYNPRANRDDGSCSYSPYTVMAFNFFSAVEAVPGHVAITTLQKQMFDAWVLSKIAAGTLSNYKAVYPCYGGIEATHKINAVDLSLGTFMGTWIHNTSGAKPDGITAYFKTGINLNPSHAVVKNATVGIYVRSDNRTAAIDIGAEETSASSQIVLEASGAVGEVGRIGDFGIQAQEGTYNYSQGYSLVSRTAANSLKVYRGGQVIATQAASNTINLPDKEIYISAYNNNGSAALFSDRQWCWAEIVNIGVDDDTVYQDNILIEGIQDAFVRGVQ